MYCPVYRLLVDPHVSERTITQRLYRPKIVLRGTLLAAKIVPPGGCQKCTDLAKSTCPGE